MTEKADLNSLGLIAYDRASKAIAVAIAEDPRSRTITMAELASAIDEASAS